MDVKTDKRDMIAGAKITVHRAVVTISARPGLYILPDYT
jgi:hypothetical protein